ncbi:MAG: ARMT1-like domain-containing protein [Desulfobacteraceae bacterium]|nr:ARMT1-like domain-containing protein [Desulfobacteraceae bacterium]
MTDAPIHHISSAMKPLQPIPQCVGCLKSLAKDLVRLAASENPDFAEKAEHITHDILKDAGNTASSSPEIANRIVREIRRITGIHDPYENFKMREMAQALEIVTHLKHHVAESLRSRAILAALGNSLDFFKNPAEALDDVTGLFHNGFSFYFDHIDQLQAHMSKRPEIVIYLTDNAGEIFFDIPLYDYLKKNCGRIYLVVKGGPSLNDLTRTELRSQNLMDRFDRVADTGTDGAGIDWDHVSSEFLDLLYAADLVVSKGMANFESLYPRCLSGPSFYLFKVKCEPIQNYIQAPAGSFLALWKNGGK